MGLVGKILKKAKRKVLPYALLGLITFVPPILSGCGGRVTSPKQDKEIINVETTDSSGQAYFTDNSTLEDVIVNISDGGDNPLPNIDVYFWDRDDSELFIAEDPEEIYESSIEIYPHNSTHDIKMFLAEELPIINEISSNSEEGIAVNNTIEAIRKGGVSSYYQTPQGLENTIKDVVAGIIKNPDGTLIYIFAANEIAEIVGDIPDWAEPAFYQVFEGIPYEEAILSNILTILPDSDKDGVLDYEDNCPNIYNPDQGACEPICTDFDLDGYYVEPDCGTEVDCNDNDNLIYPGATEICDGVDNQCPGDPGYGQVDEGCVVDIDNDGYTNDIDCNDNNPSIYPEAPELCDGIDNQCPGNPGYGQVDEGCDSLDKIAFVSRRSGRDEIYKMNPDGSSIERLTYSGESNYAGSPAWSPDRKIVFVSTRDRTPTSLNPREIYKMNPDGSSVERLTNNDITDIDPSASPDGNKIAFVSLRDGNPEIYIMNHDGSNVERLTNNSPFVETKPSWSPDGEKIVFTSSRDGLEEIYKMNPDGSSVERLTNNSYIETRPKYSPDGGKISFERYIDGNREIYKMNPNGSGQTRITNNSNNDWDPDWSPDGNKIVFTSDRDGNWEIYKMNPDGSEQTRITNNLGSDYEPAWSP